jgi:hypothetical protein
MMHPLVFGTQFLFQPISASLEKEDRFSDESFSRSVLPFGPKDDYVMLAIQETLGVEQCYSFV